MGKVKQAGVGLGVGPPVGLGVGAGVTGGVGDGLGVGLGVADGSGVGLGEGDGVATGPGAVIIDATCDEVRVIVWPPRIGARIGVSSVNGAWTRTVAI